MNKSTFTLAAVSMICGFLVAQWFMGGVRSTVVLTPPQGAQSTPPAESSLLKEIRFPLTTADIPLDREYPSIVADSKNNAVVVAWAATTKPDSGNTSRTLWIARSTDGGRNFDPPKPWREVPVYAYVSGGGNSTPDSVKPTEEKSKPARAPMTFSTHILPRLIMAGDRMILGWVEALNGGPKAAFYIAESTDGGLHFSPPRAIGGSQTNRPGFISLSSDTQGRILAAWLDNPAKIENTPVKKPSASQSGGGPKVFVSRELPDKSGFEFPRLVFAGPDGKGVCPCCDVAVVSGSADETLYAFRNNVADIRDIWVGSVKGDRNSSPVALSNRGWNFAGCPHDGPSMTDIGGKIYSTWMDAKDGKPRIFLSEMESANHQSTIKTSPVTPTLEGAQSHSRIISDDRGGIVISWDQSELKMPGMHGNHQSEPDKSGPSRGIVVLHRPSGKNAIETRIDLKSASDRLPRNPAIAIVKSSAVVAWTELGGPEGKSIRVQRVDFSEMTPVGKIAETSDAGVSSK
jgi:hypothetical protein